MLNEWSEATSTNIQYSIVNIQFGSGFAGFRYYTQESSEGDTEVSMEVKNFLSAALTAIILWGSRNVL